MDDQQVTKFAKEAYILAQQLHGLEEEMHKAADNYQGYRAYATNFNRILKKTKEILQIDDSMLESINHLSSYDPSDGMWSGDYDHASNQSIKFEQIQADIPMLKGALDSFFTFYCPSKEKQRIGFSSK